MVFSVGAIIYFAIEILFFVFHLSVIILLIAKRRSEFNGAFFAILRVLFIADFLRFVMITIIQKASLIPAFMPFYKSSAIFASFCFNFSSYLSAVQFLGHLLMTLNRFTLIWFPLKHYLLWSRNWYTVSLIVLPIFTNVWRLHEVAIFEYYSESSATISLASPDAVRQTSFIYTIVYLSTTALAALFNGLAFVKFYFYQKTTVNINVKEKSLLVTSFMVMLAQLFRISYNIMLIFPYDAEVTLFFTNIIPLLNDVFALSGSVSLLILSSSTRDRYKQFYFSKKLSSNTSAIAPSDSHHRQHGRTVAGGHR